MRGQWAGLLVGSFWGTIEGEIAGKTAPKLFDESTFVLLQKENETMRLISPSVETAREITYQVFDRLLNIYGKHSHSWLAVRTIGWGERFPWRKENQIPATKPLDNWEINPSHIHDRLMASLNLPFEERPTVKIQGVPLKKGIILGCTISLNQEPPKILFPLEFIRDLSRRLAPVAEKELLPKEPAKLLP